MTYTSKQLKNTINLIVGHERDKTDKITIQSNLTVKEIKTAYKKGSKIVSFDLSLAVAAEYEDCCISKKHIETLRSHGFIDAIFDEEFYKKGESIRISLEIKEFANIYLFVVKLGNKAFEFKNIDTDVIDISIGGYGLLQ